MTGPTMTPDDMPAHDQHPELPLDDDALEAVLSGASGSGDDLLDSALEALRGLGEAPAPEATGELAALLTAVGGPTTVAAGDVGGPPAATDEVGRRRQGHARHIATGTTAVAGILLVTATAAAAIGTLRSERPPARPTLPPSVVSHPGAHTPHPAGTSPTQLPAVPALAPEHATGTGDDDAQDAREVAVDSSTPRHQRSAGAAVANTPRRSHDDDADDEAREDDGPAVDPVDHDDPADHEVGEPDDDSTPTSHATEPDDDASSATTGDDEDEATGTSTSGGGSSTGDDSGGRHSGDGGSGDDDAPRTP